MATNAETGDGGNDDNTRIETVGRSAAYALWMEDAQSSH